MGEMYFSVLWIWKRPLIRLTGIEYVADAKSVQYARVRAVGERLLRAEHSLYAASAASLAGKIYLHYLGSNFLLTLLGVDGFQNI